MKTLSKDERGLIDGVASYIRSDSRGKQILPKVSALFTKVTSAAKRERVATVASVVALSEAEKKSVGRMLSSIIGHDVECRFVINGELLGGMKITVADWVVDTSLARDLTQLAHSLV